MQEGAKVKDGDTKLNSVAQQDSREFSGGRIYQMFTLDCDLML